MRAHVGAPMRLEKSRFKYKGQSGRRSPLEERIVEIRKLLRTDMMVVEICRELGVDDKSFRAFIKRRQLCNLKDRKEFIIRQKHVMAPRKEEARTNQRNYKP